MSGKVVMLNAGKTGLSISQAEGHLAAVDGVIYAEPMEMGERIRLARLASRLTQQALGDQLGVSKQAVTQWERGSSKPHRDNLLRIASLTGAPLAWLVFGGALPERNEDGTFVALERRGPSVPQLSMQDAASGVSPSISARHVQAFYPCSDKSFFVVLENDSCSPEYSAGAVWIIDPGAQVSPGNIVLAAAGELRRPVTGRYRMMATPQGNVEIVEPLNPSWPAARSDLEPIIIIGRMVESIQRG